MVTTLASGWPAPSERTSPREEAPVSPVEGSGRPREDELSSCSTAVNLGPRTVRRVVKEQVRAAARWLHGEGRPQGHAFRKLFLKLSESPAYRRGFIAEFEYCRQLASRMEVTRAGLWGLSGGSRITSIWGSEVSEKKDLKNIERRKIVEACERKPV